MKKQYKNIIIGFGKGGKTLAEFLANQGEQVALIERNPKMYGGTCINVACIPTKSLITQAEQGIKYPDALLKKEQLTSALRLKNYQKLSNHPNITVINGVASFVDTKTIKVTNGEQEEEELIVGERIFINTGTKPATPNIKGIEGKNIYNSTTLMQIQTLPTSIAIVGAGFIGLEFANMLLHFGCQVTLLNRSKQLLPNEDRDIAQAIQEQLQQKGVNIISDASVQAFEHNTTDTAVDTTYTVGQKTEHITTQAVLVATGRTPQTNQLNLNQVGIETDKNGYICVNEKLQTTLPNVWAIGDVNGGAQFTYISLDDFRIIKNQLYQGEAYNNRTQRTTFPTAVFLTPPYARIGLNETEAKAQGKDYTLFTLPTASIPKANILQQKAGLLKALVDNKTGEIIGCMLLCPEAHELINIIKVAMDAHLHYHIIRDNIYTHPTMAESFNMLFA